MITRLKNFEGYAYNCFCCGREIKKAYAIIGDNKIYGEKCIVKIDKNSKSQFRSADARRERFERDGARLSIELDMPIEKIEQGILTGWIK